MSQAAVQQQQQQQQGPPQHYDPQYHVTRDPYAASPPSARPSASNRQGGDAGSYPSTPQQNSFASPAASGNMSTPRGQVLPASDMAHSTYQQFYPDQPANSSPATALPIRTSGQQQSPSAAIAGYDGTGSRYSSRSAAPSNQSYASESDRTAASDSDRRRQQQQRSPREHQAPPTSGRSQRTRQAPTQSRSQTHVGQPPVDTSLPRENSAIINRIVVDPDPVTDLNRERQRVAEAQPHQPGDVMMQSMPADQEAAEAAPVQQRSRQEHLRNASHRKEVKFGDYILGSTLGEGEFGKVKMGWKRDSTVQVAIKLIRKESLAGNTTRLPKIYREISILRELQHPNIVKLHEFIETERHMGIVLEYASGGELFDYILNHRYLKDPAARRLFAQLVSGVGYLHKKGIVHRDLKLENLLLDRNKNIIITDFGFANTFNPHDELGEDVERRVQDKEFVKREKLDVIGPDNHRRGDLMQTSCGSPCYAAPELVVSDGLYTGRKVDVWSCGVILYAMLAGYLPFDDDPANPEGDNINLLYKYIVSTPLTFPEYVSPHARDLLRRILVPEPHRRADLFEVARHSWLSDYAHVVGFIGSSAKSDVDIANSARVQGGSEPLLGRSASVREPASRSPATNANTPSQRHVSTAGSDAEDSRNKQREQRDAKRRTVQVEYVAPQGSTARGDGTVPISGSGRTRARADGQGPVEVHPEPPRQREVLRKEPPTSAGMPPPGRPGGVRTASDGTAFGAQPTTSASRPTTATLGGRLPSRGNSYSLPAVATPTTENAQGHFSQPKPSTGYIISSPMPSDQGTDTSRPISQQNLAQYQQPQQPMQPPQKGHKRSSTLGSLGERLLGRSNSRRSSKNEVQPPQQSEKRDRRHPPVSMSNRMPPQPNDAEATPRPSTDSRRRPSFTFMRKNSDAPSERRNSRRFSFLPANFSLNNLGRAKENGYESEGIDSNAAGRRDSMQRARPQSKGMAFGRGASRSPSQSTTNSTIPLHYDHEREAQRQQRKSAAPQDPQGRYQKPLPLGPGPAQQGYNGTPPVQRKQYRDDGHGGNRLESGKSERNAFAQQLHLQHQQPSEPVERFYTPNEDLRQMSANQNDYLEPQFSNLSEADDGYGASANRTQPLSGGGGMMRPNQRNFDDGYERGHAGSSSGARRVMDFFRRRGKDRGQAV